MTEHLSGCLWPVLSFLLIGSVLNLFLLVVTWLWWSSNSIYQRNLLLLGLRLDPIKGDLVEVEPHPDIPRWLFAVFLWGWDSVGNWLSVAHKLLSFARYSTRRLWLPGKVWEVDWKMRHVSCSSAEALLNLIDNEFVPPPPRLYFWLVSNEFLLPAPGKDNLEEVDSRVNTITWDYGREVFGDSELARKYVRRAEELSSRRGSRIILPCFWNVPRDETKAVAAVQLDRDDG